MLHLVLRTLIYAINKIIGIVTLLHSFQVEPFLCIDIYSVSSPKILEASANMDENMWSRLRTYDSFEAPYLAHEDKCFGILVY